MKRFDAYGKLPEDFRVRHNIGGILTILSTVIIIILCIGEFLFYLQREVNPTLQVDTDRQGKIPVHFDITLPYSSCPITSVDILTKSGESMIDIEKNVKKIRLDKYGNELSEEQLKKVEAEKDIATHQKKDTCPSCLGAESAKRKCCYTCDDVVEAYREKGWRADTSKFPQCQNIEKIEMARLTKDEGCRVIGDFELNKIGGNFHIAPGSSDHGWMGHKHNFEWTGREYLDLTHTWNELSFGQNGKKFTTSQKVDTQHNRMYQYFVTVIPKKNVFLNGTEYVYDFAVNENDRSGTGEGEPGVFIYYDVSPMVIEVNEYNHGFLHFLIGICSIVGGIFTVFQIIDSFLFESIHTLKKKTELGKDV